MNWTDTGVNLLDRRFSLVDVFERAYRANVMHMLAISSDITEAEDTLSFIKSYNENRAFADPSTRIKLAMTAGVHPHYADNCDAQTWTKLSNLVADSNIVAIGECGLDFNRNFSTPQNQLYAFEKQLEIAARLNMGVYLHEREAFEPQIKLLDQYADSLRFMVTHCFTGRAAQLTAYLDLGCYIGVTGWVCDQKRGQDLRDAVAKLPLNRLLLETDAPYLFPKNLRPRKSVNEPCNIPFIAKELASLTKYSIEEIQISSFQNANKLFFNTEVLQ